jgi:hypothetical protein
VSLRMLARAAPEMPNTFPIAMDFAVPPLRSNSRRLLNNLWNPRRNVRGSFASMRPWSQYLNFVDPNGPLPRASQSHKQNR